MTAGRTARLPVAFIALCAVALVESRPDIIDVLSCGSCEWDVTEPWHPLGGGVLLKSYDCTDCQRHDLWFSCDGSSGRPGSGGITSVANGTLSGLSSTIHVNLDRCALKTLPADLFRGTPLKRLYLHGNNLEELPASVFQGLPLEQLYLNDNALKALPASIFHGQSKLRELFLYNNKLRMLPAGMFRDLTALDFLQLHTNPLVGLPTGLFGNISALPAQKALSGTLGGTNSVGCVPADFNTLVPTDKPSCPTDCASGTVWIDRTCGPCKEGTVAPADAIGADSGVCVKIASCAGTNQFVFKGCCYTCAEGFFYHDIVQDGKPKCSGSTDSRDPVSNDGASTCIGGSVTTSAGSASSSSNGSSGNGSGNSNVQTNSVAGKEGIDFAWGFAIMMFTTLASSSSDLWMM